MNENAHEFTIYEIAKLLVRGHMQVRRAIWKLRLTPVRRIGVCLLFDDESVGKIREYIGERGQRWSRRKPELEPTAAEAPCST